MPNDYYSQYETPEEIALAQEQHELSEVTKKLSGGVYDQPKTLGDLIRGDFRRVWNGAATKQQRELREWREGYHRS